MTGGPRTGRRWPTVPPGVRVGLLAGAGMLLIGAAVWAGAVGPWTGRAQAPANPRPLPSISRAPSIPTIELPTTATMPSSGGGWNPTVLLYLLGAVFLVVLLLMAASMLRNRSPAPTRARRSDPALQPPPPLPDLPDPARPFDTREAADYVIACWDELERRAAAVGLGRHPEQTSTEFLDRLQDRRSLDRRAGTELLGLYQRARFDHVRLAPDTAVRARAAADLLVAGLVGSAVVL